MPPFVITLVTYTTAQGLSLAITSGTPINGISGLFANVSSAYLWQVPVPELIFLGAALIAWFVLERTYVGRQVYAVGDREAARLAGIPVSRRIVSTYVASALLAGLVGMLSIGRMNVADPSVGPGWELTAIAAAVIGGVSCSAARAASSASRQARSCSSSSRTGCSPCMSPRTTSRSSRAASSASRFFSTGSAPATSAGGNANGELEDRSRGAGKDFRRTALGRAAAARRDHAGSPSSAPRAAAAEKPAPAA